MSNQGAPILTEPSISFLAGAQIYSGLRKSVVDRNILKRAYGYYFVLSILTFTGFFFSAYILFVNNSPAAFIFWMTVFIIFSIQIAGLFHDAGHRAIFKSVLANDILGYFVGTISNIDFGYWKDKHNRHHANPNEIDEDPDIDVPFISFTVRKKQGNFLEKSLLKYQEVLYFPVILLSLFHIKYKSFLFLKARFDPGKAWKMLLFLTGLFFWYVFPFLVLPSGKALLLILISNLGIGFYLANIFAPNHKGMPQIKKGTKMSFLERQIITARNISSNPVLDIFYIGLNYQIEHHLFPDCPRNKLRLITPYVKEICKEKNLEFSQVGIIETNRIILKELGEIAATA